MRYTVGKPVVFMKVVSTKGDDRFGSLYLTGVDTLQMVKMKSMTCVEHHKVSDAWSDEKKNTMDLSFMTQPMAPNGSTSILPHHMDNWIPLMIAKSRLLT